MEKETIELVKKMIEDGNLSQEIAEKYCPELKESEDKKIKEDLIQWINEFPDTIWRGHYKKNVIAWLEKQGEQKPVDKIGRKFNVGDIVQYITDSIDRRKIKEIDTLCNMYHTDSSPIMFEIEDEWKVVVNAEDIEQEPDDKVIKEEKPLLEKFKQAVYDCAWGKVTCKKEGETKEEYANRWAEQFLFIVRDWADDYIDFTIQQKLRNSYEKGKTDIIEKQNKQMITDKVEPKFNDGDVLVSNDTSFIVLFKGLSYLEDDIDRFKSYCHYREGIFSPIEDPNWCCNAFHPATKEQRDTLMKAMANAGWEFDFEKKELKKIEQKFTPKYKNGDCIEYRGEKYKITKVTVTPHNFFYDVSLIEAPSDSEEVVTRIGMAAEEQMFKIEQKSANKYKEWYDFIRWFVKQRVDDFRLIPSNDDIHKWGDNILNHARKVLEPKSTEWSEEDIIHLNNCISYMSRLDSSEMDWLKSLKDRVQPKQEWSEEDSYMQKQAIKCVNNSGKLEVSTEEIEGWLKSLRPQKPLTNEEIEQAKKEYRDVALSKMDYIPEELTYDDGWDDAISYMKKSLRPQTLL